MRKFIFNSPNFFPQETSFPKSLLNIPTNEDVKAYSEPSGTSNMELFAKIIKGYLLLIIFVKISTLDVWLGAEYASGIFRPFMNEIFCRYTNAALINSLYVRVHTKIIPWKFHILDHQNFWVFYPWMFVYKQWETIEYVKNSLIFKTNLWVKSSRILRIKNAKLSGYYFYMNRNI